MPGKEFHRDTIDVLQSFDAVRDDCLDVGFTQVQIRARALDDDYGGRSGLRLVIEQAALREGNVDAGVDLLKKAAGIPKGSGRPNREKVGKISRAKIEEIAKTKLQDLNTTSLEAAIRTIEGTARQMGLTVE